MNFIVQVDFPYSGPFGEQMSAAMQGLAEDIAAEPGLVWKIWTESEKEQIAGGVYLFDNEADARRYMDMGATIVAVGSDLGVFRPSNGVWYIYNLSAGTSTIFPFGLNGDKPVAADYDGDGDPDFYVARQGDVNLLFRSDAQNAGDVKPYLSVALRGVLSTRDGIGAVIRTVCPAGRSK